MPNSISFERLRKKENPSASDIKLPGTANLLKGLHNIPKDILCVPHVSELEAYWVECMKRGEDWNDKVMRVWEKEGGKRTESTPVRPQGKSRWDYPIKGLGWVRSWMLWRRKQTWWVRDHDEGHNFMSTFSQWRSSRKESRPEQHWDKRHPLRRRSIVRSLIFLEDSLQSARMRTRRPRMKSPRPNYE